MTNTNQELNEKGKGVEDQRRRELLRKIQIKKSNFKEKINKIDWVLHNCGCNKFEEEPNAEKNHILAIESKYGFGLEPCPRNPYIQMSYVIYKDRDPEIQNKFYLRSLTKDEFERFLDSAIEVYKQELARFRMYPEQFDPIARNIAIESAEKNLEFAMSALEEHRRTLYANGSTNNNGGCE